MPEIVKKAENIVMEPCDAVFDGQNLGYTHEPVKVAITAEYKEVGAQQETAPIDLILIKRTCNVTVPIKEYSLPLLAKCIPGAVLITDAEDPTKKRLDIPAKPMSLLPLGKVLTLLPQSGKVERTFTAHKAVPTGNLDYAFDRDNEMYFNVVFQCLVSQNQFLTLGDVTVEAE